MTEAADHELLINRVFDAPRELVYRAFIDPDQLSQWFGPVHFSVPRDTIEIDPRPGGVQRFVMICDDDPEFTSAVDARFTEVIENELLVGTQEVQEVPGYPGPTEQMILRLEFHDEGGKTRLVLRQGPLTAEIVGRAREGWESSFTKLDDLLAG